MVLFYSSQSISGLCNSYLKTYRTLRSFKIKQKTDKATTTNLTRKIDATFSTSFVPLQVLPFPAIRWVKPKNVEFVDFIDFCLFYLFVASMLLLWSMARSRLQNLFWRKCADVIVIVVVVVVVVTVLVFRTTSRLWRKKLDGEKARPFQY